jgi:hypothetical protein
MISPVNRNSLMFDYCWVCTRRFTSSNPSGPANREDHHIWPRNAGGTEGPLVSLCDSDHASLHKIAERIHANKNFKDLLASRPVDQTKKLVWLAMQVVKAEQAVKDDPNKLLRNSVQLNSRETLMLKRLQKLHNKGRTEIFRAALILMYHKYF